MIDPCTTGERTGACACARSHMPISSPLTTSFESLRSLVVVSRTVEKSTVELRLALRWEFQDVPTQSLAVRTDYGRWRLVAEHPHQQVRHLPYQLYGVAQNLCSFLVWHHLLRTPESQRHSSSSTDQSRQINSTNGLETGCPPSHLALSACRWYPPTKRRAQCRRDGRPLALRQSELHLSDVIIHCRKTWLFSRLTEVTLRMGRQQPGETGQAPQPILRLTWSSQHYSMHLRPRQQSMLCVNERR